jgi:hypothetical protein
MFEIKLKRTKGNKFVTHGILYIPQYDFRCHTLELKECPPVALSRIGSALDLGYYRLRGVLYEGEFGWPQLLRKVKGYHKKNQFEARLISRRTLPAGDIAIGMPHDFYSLEFNQELLNVFHTVMKEVFERNADVFLNIFKTNKFEFIEDSDVCQEDEAKYELRDIERTDFVTEED